MLIVAWQLHRCVLFEDAWGVRASMEELKVRLTVAAMMATEPTRTGRRKCTASTLAVTHGPPATLFAASPAQMSIQLSTCRSLQPFLAWTARVYPNYEKHSVMRAGLACGYHLLMSV